MSLFRKALFVLIPAFFPVMALAADLSWVGRDVYGRYCIGCHGVKGDGKGKGAVLLVVKPRDFTSGTFKFKSTPTGSLPTDDDLMRSITRGLPGSAMPAFPLISEAERRAVIAYLKTFSARWTKEKPQPAAVRPNVPETFATPESVQKGKDAFAANGCAVCHGENGDGQGPVAATLEDIWGNKVKPRNFRRGANRVGNAPEDLFMVISSGVEGTPMPPFPQISEADRWNLVAYIISLKGGR